MACLHREPEVDDVAVPDDVVLALETELPRLAAPGLAPEAHEVLVGDHLGADEAALDVAVDLARRLEDRRAAADRPGAALVLAGGEDRTMRTSQYFAKQGWIPPDKASRAGVDR